MIIFNGKEFAAKKEQLLQTKVEKLKAEKKITPHVGCLVFFEDQGGLVYSQEKKQVAKRLGIEYGIVQTSLSQDIQSIKKIVENFAQSKEITGIIIQKPWRKNWEVFFPEEKNPGEAFKIWWHKLTSLIPQSKDIDGLNPDTLQSIKVGDWQQKKLVLPATCKAVLTILDQVQAELEPKLAQQKTLIVGRSELLGTPLLYELNNRKWKSVQLVGSKEFQKLASSPTKLKEFKTIISSTGVESLIKGEMLSQDTIVIDAGFPQGDANFETVSPLAKFITPVPNGVGPVTVISLLENAVELCYNFTLNH